MERTETRKHFERFLDIRAVGGSASMLKKFRNQRLRTMGSNTKAVVHPVVEQDDQAGGKRSS